jgi:hypothetical protein
MGTITKQGYFGSPPIVTNGLAFYLDAGSKLSYPGSGTAWNDFTGKTSSTLINSPTFNALNQGSIAFSGTNQYATTPTVSLGTSYTIDLWVYPTSLVSRIHVGNLSPAGTYHINFASGLITSNIGSIVSLTPTPLIVANKWHNVVITRATTLYSAYVNGIFQDSVVTTWSAAFSIAALMSRGDTPGNYAPGNLAQVKAYTRVLSAQEIAQNYNATKARFGLL